MLQRVQSRQPPLIIRFFRGALTANRIPRRINMFHRSLQVLIHRNPAVGKLHPRVLQPKIRLRLRRGRQHHRCHAQRLLLSRPQKDHSLLLLRRLQRQHPRTRQDFHPEVLAQMLRNRLTRLHIFIRQNPLLRFHQHHFRPQSPKVFRQLTARRSCPHNQHRLRQFRHLERRIW